MINFAELPGENENVLTLRVQKKESAHLPVLVEVIKSSN